MKTEQQLKAEMTFRDAWHRVFADRLSKRLNGRCPLMLGKNLRVADYYRQECFSPDRASELFIGWMFSGVI